MTQEHGNVWKLLSNPCTMWGAVHHGCALVRLAMRYASPRDQQHPAEIMITMLLLKMIQYLVVDAYPTLLSGTERLWSRVTVLGA